ncbi:MAG: Hsp20/alpha crystallin family protein [Acidobacteria bacterium]|nr:Hsp20/alpha crystallin family protein [Acidobacteriota bacterium]
MAEPAKVLEPVRKPSPLIGPRLVPPSELFTRVEKLYDQIARRAFEIFENNGQIFGRDLDDWFKAETELLHPAHLDVSETAEAVAVRAEVPGFAANELEISVEGNRLTIAGKRETKKERKEEKTVYEEHCSDQLLRVVELPAAVDTAKAEASLKDGVLQLKLPKPAPAKKIAIEAKAS